MIYAFERLVLKRLKRRRIDAHLRFRNSQGKLGDFHSFRQIIRNWHFSRELRIIEFSLSDFDVLGFLYKKVFTIFNPGIKWKIYVSQKNIKDSKDEEKIHKMQRI